MKKIITPKSEKFLEKYLNNPSPTGFELEGQKLWLEYLSPYIDEYFTDNYGSVVGVINPKSDYKVDKSMYSSRTDFNYTALEYEQMIVEMKDWIDSNNNKYIYNKS